MTKPIVYLSGAVTGRPIEEAEAQFMQAQARLEKAGYEAINPLNLSGTGTGSYCRDMSACLKALSRAEYICLLPGWDNSPGATFERHCAMLDGLSIGSLGALENRIRSPE